MSTLLEKAKVYRPPRGSRRIGQEDLDLAVAWLFDEVSSRQVQHAYGYKSGTATLYQMALALRVAARRTLLGLTELGGQVFRKELKK